VCVCAATAIKTYRLHTGVLICMQKLFIIIWFAIFFFLFFFLFKEKKTSYLKSFKKHKCSDKKNLTYNAYLIVWFVCEFSVSLKRRSGNHKQNKKDRSKFGLFFECNFLQLYNY